MDSDMKIPIRRGEIKHEVGRGSGMALQDETLAKCVTWGFPQFK